MKDESARDKAIENLVSDKLRARSTAGNGCPNAEIIAAYFERSLAPKERVRWEAHFDTCAQCQLRIAALVRMDEAGEASMTRPPAKPHAQPAKSLSVPKSGWAFGGWAWAAPVLLVVLVAGLWYTGEFDSFMNRHTGTEQRAVVSSKPQTQPRTASAEASQKKTLAENGVAALHAGSTQAPPASSAMPVQDQMEPQQNSPSATGTIGQLARTQAPPPAPPNMNLENEQRDRRLETASAAPAAKGGPGQVRSLPVNGRNAAILSAEGQEQGAGAGQGQGVSSTAKTGVLSDVLTPVERMSQPKASTAAEVRSPSAPGASNPTTELSARLINRSTTSSQTSTGTVKGIVRDAAGAAIQGATVIVRNNRTNASKPFNTNAAGEYLAADLNPGEYSVEASAQGFESSSKKDVALLAHAERQVDFSLQLGTATQTVTVEAASQVFGKIPLQWRVGPHGLIERRSDQGVWETKPSGVAVDLYAISFASQEVGWAVGQDGTVLRSANGGESWGRVASPTNEDLVRVRATSAESAEITTRSGTIFMTTNGAAAWTRVEANP